MFMLFYFYFIVLFEKLGLDFTGLGIGFDGFGC
jgi:hypothetical protein